jgi:hypothetical protein
VRTSIARFVRLATGYSVPNRLAVTCEESIPGRTVMIDKMNASSAGKPHLAASLSRT